MTDEENIRAIIEIVVYNRCERAGCISDWLIDRLDKISGEIYRLISNEYEITPREPLAFPPHID